MIGRVETNIETPDLSNLYDMLSAAHDEYNIQSRAFDVASAHEKQPNLRYIQLCDIAVSYSRCSLFRES